MDILFDTDIANTLTQWTDRILCFGVFSIRANFCHRSIGGFSKNTDQTTTWEEIELWNRTWKRSFPPGSPRCERKPGETVSWRPGTERRRRAPASDAAGTAPSRAAPVGSAASANQRRFGIERRGLRWGGWRDETKGVFRRQPPTQKNGTIEDSGRISER